MKYNHNCQCSPVKKAKRHDIIYRQVIWASYTSQYRWNTCILFGMYVLC